MKILFFMHHLGSFRMYESVVRELAARGHQLRIVTGRSEDLGWEKALAMTRILQAGFRSQLSGGAYVPAPGRKKACANAFPPPNPPP